MSVAVSILISTRNRSASLRETLVSIGRCEVPSDLPAELLVLDNGSTDATREVIESARLPNMPVRYFFESGGGKSVALNRGLAESKGSYLLFTDDDVRVPAGWIEGMCRPIATGDADAVAGGVVFPAEIEELLKRKGLYGIREWFAATDTIDPRRPDRMVGANMAFGRHVLDRVPGFDTELGPGRLGFFDDTLFAMRLLEEEFRIKARFDTAVEHHFDTSRLTREKVRELVSKFGRCEGYLGWHWRHSEITWSEAEMRQLFRNLRLIRLLDWRGWLFGKAPCEREMQRLMTIAFREQYSQERPRPRRYELVPSKRRRVPSERLPVA